MRPDARCRFAVWNSPADARSAWAIPWALISGSASGDEVVPAGSEGRPVEVAGWGYHPKVLSRSPSPLVQLVVHGAA